MKIKLWITRDDFGSGFYVTVWDKKPEKRVSQYSDNVGYIGTYLSDIMKGARAKRSIKRLGILIQPGECIEFDMEVYGGQYRSV